jgi:hypothetical protein
MQYHIGQAGNIKNNLRIKYMAKIWITKDNLIKRLKQDGVTTKHLDVRLSQARKDIPAGDVMYVKSPGRNINIMYSETAYKIFLALFKKERGE